MPGGNPTLRQGGECHAGGGIAEQNEHALDLTGCALAPERLEEQGAIASQTLFLAKFMSDNAIARASGRREKHLKAGEYEIPAGASARAVMALLVDGRTVVHRLTVPEGRTVAEVIALVEAEKPDGFDLSTARPVLTAADVPGERWYGLILPDWPGFVAEGEEVRVYLGNAFDMVGERTVLETDKGTLHEPVFVVDHVEIASRPINVSKPHVDVYLIDIAVPRNIDPRVNELENVYLYDMDETTL